MLIRSQDNLVLINFNNLGYIECVAKTFNGGCELVVHIKEKEVILGKFKNMDKALKVISKIENLYVDNESICDNIIFYVSEEN